MREEEKKKNERDTNRGDRVSKDSFMQQGTVAPCGERKPLGVIRRGKKSDTNDTQGYRAISIY